MPRTSLPPIRCTEAERARWHLACDRAGVTYSEYIRRCLEALAVAVDAELPDGAKIDDLLGLRVDVDAAIREARERE